MEGVPSRGPLTPREARIISYLHSQDIFFKYGSWPEYLRDLALLPHKNNRQRFTLFFFLVGNGLEPELAVLWTLLVDVRSGKLIQGVYDDSAKKQMVQLKTQVYTDTLFTGSKAMMDMTLGRVVMM